MPVLGNLSYKKKGGGVTGINLFRGGYEAYETRMCEFHILLIYRH